MQGGNMYAIVDIKGHQYKVEKGKEVYVDLLDANEGDVVELDKVLYYNNGNIVKIGSPYVDGVKIKAKLEKEVKGKKLIVFKFRAKKGYRKKKGHRQKYHKLVIEDIIA